MQVARAQRIIPAIKERRLSAKAPCRTKGMPAAASFAVREE